MFQLTGVQQHKVQDMQLLRDGSACAGRDETARVAATGRRLSEASPAQFAQESPIEEANKGQLANETRIWEQLGAGHRVLSAWDNTADSRAFTAAAAAAACVSPLVSLRFGVGL